MTVRELFEKYPPKKFGWVTVERDARVNDGDDFRPNGELDNETMMFYEWDEEAGSDEAVDRGWQIYLPHSCDEWVIGNPEEAKRLADDILRAVQYCEERP